MSVFRPLPLMSSESFARYTIARRLPSILTDIIAENDFAPGVVSALRALRDEIAGRQVSPLRENAPDVEEWNLAWREYRGRTWLEMPWYFAESYFYRRLLEATGYFQPGTGEGRDPFEARKERALNDGDAVSILNKQLQIAQECNDKERFAHMLQGSLWGNRADLSNIALAASAAEGLRDSTASNLLIDQTALVRALFASGSLLRIDFICDNAGLETLLDLALADWLLSSGLCRQIVFHLKNRPFFVSDTMMKDIPPMLAALREAGGLVAALAARLDTFRNEGRWILNDDPFWTSWFCFPEMPAHLRDDLGQSDLVILKGDLNYRRLLDDRHWPPTTRLEDITGYFPASFLTLRTLKAEIIVGLQEGEFEALIEAEPDWQVNGRRGLVHLIVREK